MEKQILDYLIENDVCVYSIFHINEIELSTTSNSIFISSQIASHDYRLLINNAIKTIVSISDEKKPEKILKRYRENGIAHYSYTIDDEPDQDISSILEQSYENISDGLTRGNVLVHCRAGISRSASAVLYYLVKSRNCLDLMDAVKYLKRRRPCISPNHGFIKTLVKMLEN